MFYIYFAQEKNNPTGPIKIGRTRKSINDRLRTLSKEFRKELICIGAVISHVHCSELWIHDLFSDYRLNREWFQYNNEIIKYIEDNGLELDYNISMKEYADTPTFKSMAYSTSEDIIYAYIKQMSTQRKLQMIDYISNSLNQDANI